MTDNEIVKALECFTSGAIRCMYFYNDRFCRIKLIEEALDLINRQKKEIERYKGVIKILENDVKTAKSEAIKEFAERLKECRVIQTANMRGYIDNLVKEMTEQRKEDEGK